MAAKTENGEGAGNEGVDYMNQQGRGQRPADSKRILNHILKYLLPHLLTIGVITSAYLNFLAPPVLIYKAETGEFENIFDSRGITMRIYPQMLIRVKDDVVLVAHLDGYLEHETIHFNGKKASMIKAHQEYCNELRNYIRLAILDDLRKTYGNQVSEEIEKNLHLSVSFLGGVQYQTLLGNQVLKYCILESDGLIVDYEENAERIQQRLFETDITLYDDLRAIAADTQVTAVIDSAVAEIGDLV